MAVARTSFVERDRNVQFLSYWTDNGAYYSGGAWGEAGGGGKHVNKAAFREVAAGLKRAGLDEAVRRFVAQEQIALASELEEVQGRVLKTQAQAISGEDE